MANKKISQLTSATTPLTGTEELAIVQNGITKKVAASQLGSGGLDIETYQIFITSLTASPMPGAPSSINNIFRGTNSTLIGAGGSMDNVSIIELSDGSLLTFITSTGAVPA